MNIGSRPIGLDEPTYCLAEIGSNHGGDLNLARQLLRAASWAGADAAKLQIRTNRELYTREFYTSPYNSENAYGVTYGEHREALELPIHHLEALVEEAEGLGLQLFATAFDPWAVETCVGLGFPAIKIASGDLSNLPLIRIALASELPLIISTGGHEQADVERVFETVITEGAQHRVAFLHCVASYPCAYADLNLNVIGYLRNLYGKYGITIGASLHDNGIAMAVVAQMLGARIIEKHFTLDRTMKGTDHAFSLEPAGFRKMVRDIRRTELALGDGIKRILPVEVEPIRKMSKAIHARVALPAGHVLAPEDLILRSPGGGMSPAMLDAIVGFSLIRGYEPEEMIRVEDLVQASDQAVPA